MVYYYHKVWCVLLLGWISLYMVRVGLAPILHPIMEEFKLSYAQAGFLSSAVFWAYTFMQIPAGHLGDRWSRRKFLLIGTFSWSFLCLLTGFANGFIFLFWVRLFTGLAEGTYFGNDRPIIAAFTPSEKMARGQGFTVMGMGIGMGLGLMLAGQIGEIFGWRAVFFIYSIPSLAAFFFIWKIVKDPVNPQVGQTAGKVNYKMVFKNKKLWALYFAGFAIMFNFWLLGTWTPTILLELGVKGIGSSAMYSAILGFISIPALIISGQLSDRIKKKGGEYYRPMAVSILIAFFITAFLGVSLDLQLGLGWFVILLTLGGLATWSFFPPFYAMIPDQVPRDILGTTFGLANTIGFMASLIAPWLAGYLRDKTNSFSWAFYLTALVLAMGFFCVLLATKWAAHIIDGERARSVND